METLKELRSVLLGGLITLSLVIFLRPAEDTGVTAAVVDQNLRRPAVVINTGSCSYLFSIELAPGDPIYSQNIRVQVSPIGFSKEKVMRASDHFPPHILQED